MPKGFSDYQSDVHGWVASLFANAVLLTDRDIYQMYAGEENYQRLTAAFEAAFPRIVDLNRLGDYWPHVTNNIDFNLSGALGREDMVVGSIKFTANKTDVSNLLQSGEIDEIAIVPHTAFKFTAQN